MTRRGQGGVALITMMLVAALAATAAAFMAWQQNLAVRQAENLRDRAQASAIARAAVAWADLILAEDDPELDHLNEFWARALPPLAVEYGEVTGGMRDAQAFFNLNNLARVTPPASAPGGADPGAADADLQTFRRLLALLNLPTDLADALADWLDPDSEVRYPGGAEDGDYLLLDTPYRAANRPLDDVADLYRVRGFDAAVVERLRPFVTALPQATPVNLNTAPAEVLAAVLPELGIGGARVLVEARAVNPFASVADARARVPQAAAPGATVAVNTHYFLARADARFGRARAGFEALLERRANNALRPRWLRAL